MTQKNGQDERAFLEDLRATADEADISGMTLDGALCLQLLTGLQDKRLVEKLGEVEDPSIDKFSRIINAHMHAKASTPSQTLKTSTGQPNKKNSPSKPGSQAGAGSRPQLSEKEIARRKALYNKCVRCAEPGHFVKDCTVRSNVTCGRCKVKGHIAKACNAVPAARATTEAGNPEQLQLTYLPEGEEEWRTASANAVQTAAAHSQPTPSMLL